jgi:hypothetical protein
METQTKKSTVKLSHLLHNDAKQIKLDFFFDPELIEDVKEIQGIRWSRENKCWYILNNKENLKLIFDALKGKVIIDTSEFFRKNMSNKSEFSENKPEKNYYEIIDQYIEHLKGKSYSNSTIKGQKATITNFVDFLLSRKIIFTEIA